MSISYVSYNKGQESKGVGSQFANARKSTFWRGGLTAGPPDALAASGTQACVLLAEERICSHINSFLPVAKLALPSASLHAKASLLIPLQPEGAARASEKGHSLSQRH